MRRREFLQAAAAGALLLQSGSLRSAPNEIAPHTLTVISGSPAERGRKYGQLFQKPIAAFLEKDIETAFVGKPSTRDQMRDYSRRCADVVEKQLPEIFAELTGIASGSGQKLEDLVLVSAHEELWHKGVLPAQQHCTAVAAGPPATKDGHTYVGQTWDWMQSVAGLSQMLLWKRTEGPSLLAYAYPGLWVGAGLNSAGIAHTWTSASDDQKSPRVGVPSYLYLANLLYQPSIDAVISEAKRVTHAGWFTFVMADGKGRLLNVEGSPSELAVEEHQGTLARVLYASKQMTTTASGEVRRQPHARCVSTQALLEKSRGQIDAAFLKDAFSDPAHGICVGSHTIDMMIYDTTDKKAYLSRGPHYGIEWKEFSFDADRS